MLDSAVQIADNVDAVLKGGTVVRATVPSSTEYEAVNLPVLKSSKAVPTSVYRYYDKNKILIYVGITSTGITRNRQHNADKAWWKYVASQEIDHYGSRDAARFNEINLINRFRPPFNRQHNPDYEAIHAYYLELVGEGPPARLVLAERVARCKVVDLSFVSHIAPESVLQFDAIIRDELVAKSLRHDRQKPAPVLLGASNKCCGHVCDLENVALASRISIRFKGKWQPNVVPLMKAEGHIKPAANGAFCSFKKIVLYFGVEGE